MSFLIIMFGSPVVDISLPYGLHPYHIQDHPSYNFLNLHSTKQIVSISHNIQYIYIHGNNSKRNHKLILELFTTTIQSLPLIQLSIGMNSSLHTHVLSSHIFFLLFRDIHINMSPPTDLFFNLWLCSYFNLQLSCHNI